MHLDGALRVANVMRLLLGNVVDIGEEGGQVVVSHVLEGELPKLFVLVRVVLGMVSRVLVPPAVAQPDVVAFVGQHESRSFVFVVDEPGVRTIEQAVLQDDWLSPVPDLRALALYPKNSEDVSVLSDDPMCLHRIIVVLAVVSKLQLGLGMRTMADHQQRSQEKQQQVALHYWRFIIQSYMPIAGYNTGLSQSIGKGGKMVRMEARSEYLMNEIGSDKVSLLVRIATKQKWPSGLRRQIQALFRKGAGSNPVFYIFLPNEDHKTSRSDSNPSPHHSSSSFKKG